jgi:serine/threonine protein kinase
VSGDAESKVEEFAQKAASLDVKDRSGFLLEVCKGDVDLLKLVLSRLKELVPTESAIDEPIVIPSPAASVGSGGSAPGVGVLGPFSAQFQIVRELGSGTFGVVYEAFDTALQRLVAVKVLRPEYAAQSLMRERFRREGQKMAAVAGPFVVPVMHGVPDNVVPFLVMELVPGGSLRARLTRGPVGYREFLWLGLGLARGLAGLHGHAGQEVVHRDVKPENVLLRPGKAEFLDPLLGDFGLARAKDDSTLTMVAAAVGSPAYMAPEQWKGEAVPASDVFSLAVMFFEMLAGVRPFDGPSFLELTDAANTPIRHPQYAAKSAAVAEHRELAGLIDRMLCYFPADRPSLESEVIPTLESLMNPTPSPPPPPVPPPPPPPPIGDPIGGVRPRSRLPLWILLGVLALVVGGGLYYKFGRGDEEPMDPRTRLMVEAFKAKEAGRFEVGLAKADECVTEFGKAAEREHARLLKTGLELPQDIVVDRDPKMARRAADNGLVNDVAACWLVKGDCLKGLDRPSEARAAYAEAAKFTLARCQTLDKRAYWDVSEAASNRLSALGPAAKN